MTLEDLKNDIKEFAISCGLSEESNGSKAANAVWRDDSACRGDAKNGIKIFEDIKGAYFGFIRPEEQKSGAYKDVSLVFFPSSPEAQQMLVTLTVGSENFELDLPISQDSGWRRRFQKLLLSQKQNGSILAHYIKPSFSDTQTMMSEQMFARLRPGNAGVVKSYGKFVLAAAWVDCQDSDFPTAIKQWIALYAKLRSWCTSERQRKTIKSTLPPNPIVQKNVMGEVQDLLKKRRFVVLQGAPGVGKTHTARELSKGYKHVVFEQFHAATTYSDFVWGLRPCLNPNGNAPQFEARKGALYRAIETALQHRDEEVLLIIDEINRANLSNVLGPVFYLFEPSAPTSNFKVRVGDMEITELPKNLRVIATMNTADRSIAVVDFALRRRFAWYTLQAQPFAGMEKDFREEDFDKVSEIFDLYATDAELDLQPGGSYFIAKDDDEFKARLEYELMPLMKEYLEQGYLAPARAEIVNYFLGHGLEMFR